MYVIVEPHRTLAEVRLLTSDYYLTFIMSTDVRASGYIAVLALSVTEDLYSIIIAGKRNRCVLMPKQT